MYYEINVLLNGTHFFATAERSITDPTGCAIVLKRLKAAFPEQQGFSVVVTQWKKVGYRVKETELPTIAD